MSVRRDLLTDASGEATKRFILDFEVDRFYIYDNSVDDRDAQLVLRAADSRVVKAYDDAPAWAGPILERLAPRES